MVSVWLPRWPTDRRARREGDGSPFASADRPAALTRPEAGALRLASLNAAAEAEGLYRGQALADARAILPGLAIAPSDPDGDARALYALARAATRWSPLVAPRPRGREDDDGEHGLALDVTGVAHLFGGEDALLADILTRLNERGVAARAACARSFALAWGLARFEPRAADGLLVAPSRNDERAARDALPVEALRLPPATVEALRLLGLKTVGRVLAQPRGSLARRFGRGLILRLDQMTGEQIEAIEPLLPEPPCAVRARLAEPLMLREGIVEATRRLARALTAELETRAEGARALTLALYRVDGRVLEVAVGAARPTRDPRHIARLFAERLERVELDLGFGVDVVALAASSTQRLDGEQDDLEADGGRVAARDLASLVDRLAARLGQDAVKRAAFRESHLPERAAGWRSVGERSSPAVQDVGRPASLPPRSGGRSRGGPSGPAERRSALMRLQTPERVEAVAEVPDGPPRLFRWRRTLHRVVRAEGPERIAPEWWREGAGGTRDYFRVETTEGRRFELAREGLFARETDAPIWFVHGAGV
jgi:protein ImuB